MIKDNVKRNNLTFRFVHQSDKSRFLIIRQNISNLGVSSFDCLQIPNFLSFEIYSYHLPFPHHTQIYEYLPKLLKHAPSNPLILRQILSTVCIMYIPDAVENILECVLGLLHLVLAAWPSVMPRYFSTMRIATIHHYPLLN